MVSTSKDNFTILRHFAFSYDENQKADKQRAENDGCLRHDVFKPTYRLSVPRPDNAHRPRKR